MAQVDFVAILVVFLFGTFVKGVKLGNICFFVLNVDAGWKKQTCNLKMHKWMFSLSVTFEL